MEFIVKFNFMSLNEVIGLSKTHWSKYAAIKKKLTNSIAIQCPPTKINRPVTIHFTWHCKNKRADPDNIAFNKKFVLDGMVKKGTIPTDTPHIIEGFTDHFKYDTKQEYVQILIE